MKKLNIAIIGLGNIGSYLYEYLNDNKKILTKKNNCLPLIKYVSARNKKKNRHIKIKKNQWLNNYLDATKLKDVDLIVELIGGSEGPAKKLVFNDGDFNSKLMIISEGPDQKDDEVGKPFAGDAGSLLNKMFEAINIKRENIYITNVINYRPPDDRKPTTSEINRYSKF